MNLEVYLESIRSRGERDLLKGLHKEEKRESKTVGRSMCKSRETQIA